MKKFLISALMIATVFAMTISDAEARRLGGGRSFGRQSSSVSRQATPSPSGSSSSFNQPRPAAANAMPGVAPSAMGPKPPSRWKGIVGGLIGGAILGGLLSHFGFGGAMAGGLGSILTIALLGFAAFFIFRFIRSRMSGGTSGFSQPAYAGVPPVSPYSDNVSRFEPLQNSSSAMSQNAPAAPWGVPADFDVPGFLRNAKTYFIRLQAAWDKADINDIREFTTTEMYAEIKMDIQERGASPNVTDVVSIDAELLGLETVGNDYLASVRFSGMIKEEPNAPANAFNEVWNLSKSVSGAGGWVLAGIQQV